MSIYFMSLYEERRHVYNYRVIYTRTPYTCWDPGSDALNDTLRTNPPHGTASLLAHCSIQHRYSGK